MVSLLDFISSISQTDDIKDVSAWTIGRSDLLAPRGGRPTALNPLSYGPEYGTFDDEILPLPISPQIPLGPTDISFCLKHTAPVIIDACVQQIFLAQLEYDK